MSNVHSLISQTKKASSPSSNTEGLNDDIIFTDELVIGIVGGKGAGVTKISKMLIEIMENDFKYAAKEQDLGDFINEDDFIGDIVGATTLKINKGNELRRKFGHDILVKRFIDRQFISRTENGLLTADDITLPTPKNLRQVTIVHSLKNPAEISTLRKTYGDMFYCLGVFASDAARQKTIVSEEKVKVGHAKTESELNAYAKDILDRERNEKHDFGQKVEKSLLLADYFINNTDSSDQHRMKNTADLKKSLEAFLNIIFGIDYPTAKAHESGMAAAYNASANSACLSRGVGAAIFSAEHELLSIGWNEVPQFGGGLYGSKLDGKTKSRCFEVEKPGCRKDEDNQYIQTQIFNALKEDGLISANITLDKLNDTLKVTDISAKLEHSRAIHAEMEAILAIARAGKLGIKGGYLYTTTFPCHNCARHIVASGIKQVYYIEPYNKSAATTLHDDSITINNEQDKLNISLYEGVHPRNLTKYYLKNNIDKKTKTGEYIKTNKREAKPVLRESLRSFYEIEGFISNNIRQMRDGG